MEQQYQKAGFTVSWKAVCTKDGQEGMQRFSEPGLSPRHITTPLLAVPPAQDLPLPPFRSCTLQPSPASTPLQPNCLPSPLDSKLTCPTPSCDTSPSRRFLSLLKWPASPGPYPLAKEWI